MGTQCRALIVPLHRECGTLYKVTERRKVDVLACLSQNDPGVGSGETVDPLFSECLTYERERVDLRHTLSLLNDGPFSTMKLLLCVQQPTCQPKLARGPFASCVTPNSPEHLQHSYSPPPSSLVHPSFFVSSITYISFPLFPAQSSQPGFLLPGLPVCIPSSLFFSFSS